MIAQAGDCIGNRQDAASELWTNLIDAVNRSWPVNQRGAKAQDVLLQVYTGILLQWYEKADTKSFAFYREYVDQFADRVKMAESTGRESRYYQRLHLLHKLRESASAKELAEFLVEAHPDVGQFSRIWAQTDKVQQLVLSDFEMGPALWRLLLTGVALAGGLTTLWQWHQFLLGLMPVWQWSALMILGILGFWAFNVCRWYRSCVVLALSRLYFGAQYRYRHISWDAIHRIQLRGRRWIWLDLEEGITLILQVPSQDRTWLARTIYELVRRAHTASDGP